ncbi:2OG-Fe(II) oxygenase [Roseivivax sp. CAU 1761]
MFRPHSIPDAFTAAECDRVIALTEAVPAEDAGLARGGRDHNLRRSDLVWLDDLPEAEWVMGRLVDLVRRANRDVFGFDLSDFAESPQVARYGAEREGHFDWHADIGEGRLAARRKLTLVVQLSDAESYSGGVLEIMPSAAALPAARTRGSATLFPAFLLHRVTPVTAGARHSLTVWAHGPAFR